MDPNEALRRIRELVEQQAGSSSGNEGEALAEQVRALDEWLSKGGFLPAEWQARDYAYAVAHTARVVVEPLGGPHPGVDGFPPEGSEMESQYPRDFEDGEGIHRPSYGE